MSRCQPSTMTKSKILNGSDIIVGGSIFMFRAVPGGFVPAEDQGYLISALMLPDGASLQRTRVTGESFQQKLKQDEGVDKVFVIAGNDIIGGGLKPNAGTVFIPLKDWSERSTGADELAKKFTGLGMTLPDGLGIVFNPPAIRGLGAAGGFEAYIQARGDADPQKLAGVIQQFMEALKKRPELTGINTFFRPTSPQLYVEVDEAKAISMDIPVADVYQSLQATSAQSAAKPVTTPPRANTERKPSVRWWHHLGLWRALAGSGFAMAAVLAAVLVTRTAPVAAPPQFMVVLVAPQDKAPGWVVQASSPRQISLIPLGVAEVPADKALEFWTKADGWSGPVSLGLVQPGQPLQIPLDKLPPLQPNQLFELTLEPPTGSPIGKPTGPIQFIGRAVKVL